MAATTWRRMAEVLARRLESHAYCESHPESRPGEGCPFCRDREVYRLWQRKAGVQDPPPYTGPTVNILDLRQGGQQRN